MAQVRELCIHLHEGDFDAAEEIALKMELFDIPLAGEFFGILVHGENPDWVAWSEEKPKNDYQLGDDGEIEDAGTNSDR